jgi:hypothetical protein
MAIEYSESIIERGLRYDCERGASWGQVGGKFVSHSYEGMGTIAFLATIGYT